MRSLFCPHPTENMYSAEQLTEKINRYIAELRYARKPEALYAPIEYVLAEGGKRLRPTLMLLAYNLHKPDVDTILSAAAAIEMYHNYTLLHDDLMDRADMRRGKPTVHKVWNDNTAILSGDTMLVLAYQLLWEAESEESRAVWQVFNQTAIEIGEGQQFDMEFETRCDVTEEEYIEMIRLKTSVLLAASLKIGAILAGAPKKQTEQLYRFGELIGLAFQLQDDYLDVYGDEAVFGKKIGGDILCNKKTYMLINALRLANNEQRHSLEHWLNATDYDAKEKIAAVTALYNEIGIGALCQLKIEQYFEEGMACLAAMEMTPAQVEPLKQFVESLMQRDA